MPWEYGCGVAEAAALENTLGIEGILLSNGEKPRTVQRRKLLGKLNHRSAC
jgi:hypothetical protein